MDRAEAIKVLEDGDWWDNLDEYFETLDPKGFKALHEALDMAIAALREQEQSKWKPVSDPPKMDGHYLVNIHQENDESGESGDFVVDAWYQNNSLLFVPKEIGWTLLNEWYDLSAQMRPFITHWMPLPTPPEGGAE